MRTSVVTTGTKRIIGYFPHWVIHTPHYYVSDIPAALLTHVVYAFADVTAAGECASVNPSDDQTNFPALQQLKHRFPHLKTLISVGGASNSANFPAATNSKAARQHFAASCVQFMKQNGFDG